jgi:hypothetical protein
METDSHHDDDLQPTGPDEDKLPTETTSELEQSLQARMAKGGTVPTLPTRTEVEQHN